MGRERHDADYFPFYVKEGKTLFFLKKKFGLEGIGFFTELMRLLTRTPFHFITIKENEIDEIYFWESIGTNKERGNEIMNMLVFTEKIDKILWNDYRTVYCKDLVDSLQTLYTRRKANVITIESIIESIKNEAPIMSLVDNYENESGIVLSDEQKIAIMEKFYFKNFPSAEKELKRFVEFYENRNWEDKNGKKINTGNLKQLVIKRYLLNY